MKNYSDLIKLPTFEERFEYLKVPGTVGQSIFGSKRYLEQRLYHSKEWQKFRDSIFIRDNGMDLGLDGYEIKDRPTLHHINPVSLDQIMNMSSSFSDLLNTELFDPENVILASYHTHKAIHYGSLDTIRNNYRPIERKPNDTCPWKETR